MSDYLSDEKKVGQMLRYLSGDIGLAFKSDLVKLYNDNDIGRECADWHWMIIKYSPDPVLARKYVSVLQFCYENNVSPSDLEAWKKTMRIVLPEEFMQKMAGFTQVPQLAIMDETHGERKEEWEKKVRDSSEVLW